MAWTWRSGDRSSRGEEAEESGCLQMVGPWRGGDKVGGRDRYGLCGGEGASAVEVGRFSLGNALVCQVDSCASQQHDQGLLQTGTHASWNSDDDPWCEIRQYESCQWRKGHEIETAEGWA